MQPTRHSDQWPGARITADGIKLRRDPSVVPYGGHREQDRVTEAPKSQIISDDQ